MRNGVGDEPKQKPEESGKPRPWPQMYQREEPRFDRPWIGSHDSLGRDDRDPREDLEPEGDGFDEPNLDRSVR